MSKNEIIIKGARQHNLRNIDVRIPRDAMVVLTGPSGSGKSSLAFDTIYAEGQRRYIESLSNYARQFLGQMDKPDVDYIEGLSPAICIEQRAASHNPRSTVATSTEIYDYFRILFARIGKPHCHICGRPIQKQAVQQIVDKVLGLGGGRKIMVLSPIARGEKGEYKDVLEDVRKAGFVRVRVDGKELEVDREIKLDKNKKHKIDIIVDRLAIKPEIRVRLSDSIQAALKHSKGLAVIEVEGEKEPLTFSEKLACPEHGTSLEELSPRMFSFNNPYGACRECTGLGEKMEMDPDLVIPDKSKSLLGGAIEPWTGAIGGYYFQSLACAAEHHGIDLHAPVKTLSKEALDIVLHGSDERIKFEYHGGSGTHFERYGTFEGVMSNLERRYKETKSEPMREWIRGYMGSAPCTSCGGKRLRPEILAVKVGGKSIAETSGMSISHSLEFFSGLELSERDKLISRQILKEILSRLKFLSDLGLGYLTLDRATSTLSGGEAQRIQLATQIGASLVGVLYILDEPTIGLHPRDDKRLIENLHRLRDVGSTVIVVEHDEAVMRAADHIVDMGPGAGVHGGKVVFSGTPKDMLACKESLTGQYLSGKKSIPTPKPEERRAGSGKHLIVKGARENNLKKINVDIPLGTFSCITGVSGSGKSTLVHEILYKALSHRIYGSIVKPGRHDEIIGAENIDKVIIIDQSPIGRTPRSNPATYTEVFTEIRNLFARLPEARARGYAPGRFSFNVSGGRCEACEGDGIIRLEMHFLPDVYIPCEVCHGRRYNRETMEVKFKGKSIADILEMNVEQALPLFENIPRIQKKLQTIADVGLGYIALGQSATTLSGGEAQRVKLATELSRRATGKTLYILDEPTTGLHFDDTKKLLSVLNRLVDAGNSILVIEHNLDVIKTADWIIDLGPEGGDEGGNIVAEGTPEDIAKTKGSYTGQFLSGVLGKSR